MELACSPNLTCEAPTTSFESALETSGIRPSSHLLTTMNGRLMPYGLANFQGFLNEVFREFLHRFVIVYIDDILIYSWTLAFRS